MQNWYAINVKSRHEFVAQGELSRKKIDTFLPTVNRTRQWKDRKKHVDFPVFPGYLFVWLPSLQEAFLSVLRTRGVVTLLSSQPGCPTPIPDDEIRSLILLLQSKQDFDIYPHLKAGTPVRITRGPLQGAMGILEKKEDGHMFIVSVDLLGRSVGVKIYAEDIEAQ